VKQRITIEQLNELTIKQKESLYLWWQDHIEEGDCIYYERWGGVGVITSITRYPRKDTNPYYTATNDCSPSDTDWFIHAEKTYPITEADPNGDWLQEPLPMLSIGQMIALVHDKCSEYGFQYYNTTCDYHVWLGNDLERKIGYWADELCDALWGATKAIFGGG
jgi:hypothetical protein